MAKRKKRKREKWVVYPEGYAVLMIAGGWLIKVGSWLTQRGGHGVGLTFIPDPNHETEPRPLTWE